MNPNFLNEDARFSRRQSLVAAAGLSALLTARTNPVLAAEGNASAVNWDAISKEFLIDRSLTYLNTGTLGSSPKPVLEARRVIEQKLESNPAGEGFGSVLRDAEAVAVKVADLLNCDAKDVTVTRNTTEGMNFVAEGINLQAGQRVLTSNHEHPGGLRAWQYFKKTRGSEVDVVEIPSPPKDEDEVVAAFQNAITDKTRVIMCSHVHFSNGVKSPIARLSELAHRRGCLMIVDGAQASGGVPVNVKELGCDAYVSSGHKFLLGPKGTGFLYISERARNEIKPMQLDDGYGYYTAIRGTNGMPEAIGLGNVIDWFKQVGRDAVFERLMFLRNSLYEVLRQAKHVRIASPPPGSSMASQLLCFSVTDRDRFPKLQEQFTKDKVIYRGVNVNGIDIRLSVHVYNTEADVAKFAESLNKGLS